MIHCFIATLCFVRSNTDHTHCTISVMPSKHIKLSELQMRVSLSILSQNFYAISFVNSIIM